MEKKGIISLLITSLIFATFGIFANILNKEISIYKILISVNFIQLIGFSISIFRSGFKIKFKDISKLILFGFFNSLPIFFFNLAVSIEKIALVLVIQNSVTLILSSFIAIIFFKERLDFKENGLILIIILGIVTIFFPNIINPIGLMFAMLVGSSNVIVNIFRRVLGKQYSISILGFTTSLVGIILNLFLLILSKESLNFTFSINILFHLVLYGLLNLVTTALLIIGFKNIHFTLGNIILTLEIPFGIILGILLLGQTFMYNEFTGSIIVLISIILIRIIQREKDIKKNNIN